MFRESKPSKSLLIPRVIPKDSDIDWESYSIWYRANHIKSNSTSNLMIKYAIDYSGILLKSDRRKLTELMGMSKDKRRLVMSSLSNLAKYLGIYDKWQTIRRNNGLKWEKRSALETFLSIMNSNVNDTAGWLKGTIKVLPKKYATALVFTALTGLRPSEACESCKIIVKLAEEGSLQEYLDKDLMMLQHFKYKQQFLRGSKNAFISFISDELLKLVLKHKPTMKYTCVTSAIRKKQQKIRVKELRKLYSTTLRNHMPSEVIDLLQGRIGQSIFMRFYYKPFLQDIKTKTLEAIKPLEDELFLVLNH